MKRATTFVGGVHPPEGKTCAALASQAVPLPARLYVPLLQHIGVPADPVVAKKDKVGRGQLIGQAPAGKLGANVHAPTSGTVVDLAPYPHPNGKELPAIWIEPDGEDRWADGLAEHPDPLALPREELLALVRAAGLVGMGGAAFPSHVKLAPPATARIDTLIINGAECEPMLTSDHRLMLEQPEEVVQGVRVLARILAVPRTVLAVERNKRDALQALAPAAAAAGIELVECPVKYPQGAEKQLIQVVTGRQVPVRQLPLAVGVVVHNVASAAAAWQAVRHGRPLTERLTTIAGGGVVRPANLRTRLGMPIAHLIAQCGGYRDAAALLILGGPMMGHALATDAVPVVKATGGVLVLERDAARPPEFGPCIRCGRCVAVCPMRREPREVGLAVELGLLKHDALLKSPLDALECVECGSCAFACPARRPLVEFMRRGKAAIAAHQATQRAAR